MARVLTALTPVHLRELANRAPPRLADFIRNQINDDDADSSDAESIPELKKPRMTASEDLADVLRAIKAEQVEQRKILVSLQRAPATPVPSLTTAYTTDITVWRHAHEAGTITGMLDAAETEVRRAKHNLAMTGRALIDTARLMVTQDWSVLKPLVTEILIHDAVVGFMDTRRCDIRFYERAKPYLRAAGDTLWTGLATTASRVSEVLAGPAARERDDGGGHRGAGPRRDPAPQTYRGGRGSRRAPRPREQQDPRPAEK